MTADRIYHLALADDWAAALRDGSYRTSTLGRSLDDEGFIHCSFASQVAMIADAVYRGRSDVVLLSIDPTLVAAEVREENLEGGEQRFPHIYGPLPVAAVERVTPVPVADDDRLEVGPLLDAAG